MFLLIAQDDKGRRRGLTWLAVFLILLAGGYLFLTRGPTAQAQPTGAEEIMAYARQLNARAWKNIPGHGPWLWVSFVLENPLAQGTDPDTGWPIFRRSRMDNAYRFDDQGRITAVVGRTSHLDGPHTYRSVWVPGRFFRDPPLVGQEELTWDTWEKHPVLDWCIEGIIAGQLGRSRGQVRVLPPQEARAWSPQAWGLIYEEDLEEPLVLQEVAGAPTATKMQIVCVWDEPTGQPRLNAQYYILEGGERVLFARGSDYTLRWISELPADLAALWESQG